LAIALTYQIRTITHALERLNQGKAAAESPAVEPTRHGLFI
jgi:hypothetical protein